MSSSLCCAVSWPSGHPSSTSTCCGTSISLNPFDEHESSGDPSKQPIWSTAIWKYCNTIWWADRELCIWKSNSNWFLWWHQTLNIWDLHQCLWHLLLNPVHSEMVIFSCQMQVFLIYVIGLLWLLCAENSVYPLAFSSFSPGYVERCNFNLEDDGSQEI